MILAQFLDWKIQPEIQHEARSRLGLRTMKNQFPFPWIGYSLSFI